MPQRPRVFPHTTLFLVGLFATAVGAPQQAAYEASPIHYSKSTPTDPVAAVDGKLASGQARLTFDGPQGFLKSVLKELEVPVASQGLVFSKTSFQRQWINPRSPRAIYFNDDLYVGWVPGAEVLELASQDPQLGTVFYTLDQDPEKPRRFQRQTDHCLQCHDSSGLTLGVPGVTIRSVYAAADGQPRFNLGGFRTSWRSPFEERWGGWYVTGEHGSLRHLGNVLFPEDPDLKALRDRGANLTDLSKRIETDVFPTPTSDIVALMVLEYQTAAHNLITRANQETRIALLQNDEIQRNLGVPARPLREGTLKRIAYACEPLVEGLLYTEEAALGQTVKGNSTFAEDFEKRGPFDRKGRSLRQFDLKQRMFRYPLSYLIYSKAFAGLPDDAKDYVARRLKDILEGRDPKPKFAHLTPELRRDLMEIAVETHPWLAKAWKQP